MSLLVWAVAVLVLLGVLILVHELGHFIFARLFDVKVLRFSLGFGPRLFGFTHRETEYRLSLVPLGGYVRNEFATKGMYVFEKSWNGGFRQVASEKKPIRTVDARVDRRSSAR